MLRSICNNIKVLIIGSGSIGNKHYSYLNSLGCVIKILSRRPDVGDFSDLDQALPNNFDLIIIATETSTHAKIIKEVQKRRFKGQLFIEKPFAVNLEDTEGIDDANRIWVGYNLRFHPAIIRAKEILTNQMDSVYYAHFHVGQALSTWRQGRNSLETYSALKSLGGGVVHDLSHEIDLAHFLFGELNCMKSFVGKYGDQTVDSDDMALILAKNNLGALISINMNYLDHNPTRFIQISTKNQTLKVDLINSTLETQNESHKFPDGMQQSYMNMWEEMLEICRGAPSHHLCDFHQGRTVLQSIEDIYTNAL